MAKLKTTAVIPALNEEATIAKVIQGLKKYTDEIIVVDDASKDKTAIVAEEEGAIVITHEENKGYGKSLNDGFVLAAERKAGVLLTFDGDDQHNPEDIPQIIDPILEGKADVVVGKRPRHARISEHLFAIVSRLKAGIDDPLCGLKAYHIKVYNDVKYFDRISSVGTELMFNAKKLGYRVIQRDIKLNARQDESRFGRNLKAELKILRAIIKILIFC